MTQKAVLRHSLSLSAAAVVCASLLSVPSIAEAGPRRARLSKDLAERVKNREAATVIVAGTESELEAIAARHGARVKKMLRGAAVLEVSADQMETLSTDPAVDHLSGDVPVRRTMAVTAQTVGADQVWMKSGVTARGLQRLGHWRRRHRLRRRHQSPVAAQQGHGELRFHRLVGSARCLGSRHARRQHHCRAG